MVWKELFRQGAFSFYYKWRNGTVYMGLWWGFSGRVGKELQWRRSLTMGKIKLSLKRIGRTLYASRKLLPESEFDRKLIPTAQLMAVLIFHSCISYNCESTKMFGQSYFIHTCYREKLAQEEYHTNGIRIQFSSIFASSSISTYHCTVLSIIHFSWVPYFLSCCQIYMNLCYC